MEDRSDKETADRLPQDYRELLMTNSSQTLLLLTANLNGSSPPAVKVVTLV